ncbi:MAG: hypoxanthine phosphoribosyltransferase [bacterium]
MTCRTPSSQPDLSHVLFTADQLKQRVNEVADEIARDYGKGEFIAASIMKGSFIFAADLIRCLSDRDVHPVVDFITLSSYGSETSSRGTVTLLNELSLPVAGHRVLLIDDILDTGLTLQTACQLLSGRGATDVRTCVLLDKPSRRSVPISANYCGFQVDDHFIVGYGLDYNNRYRHLPFLTTLIKPGTS